MTTTPAAPRHVPVNGITVIGMIVAPDIARMDRLIGVRAVAQANSVDDVVRTGHHRRAK